MATGAKNSASKPYSYQRANAMGNDKNKDANTEFGTEMQNLSKISVQPLISHFATVNHFDDHAATADVTSVVSKVNEEPEERKHDVNDDASSNSSSSSSSSSSSRTLTSEDEIHLKGLCDGCSPTFNKLVLEDTFLFSKLTPELVHIVAKAITMCAHDDINEEVSLTNKFFIRELMMQFKAANKNSYSEFLIELYTSYNTDEQIIYDCITYCKCFLPKGQTQFPIFQTVKGAKAVYNAIQAPNRKVIANLKDPDFMEFVEKYIK